MKILRSGFVLVYILFLTFSACSQQTNHPKNVILMISDGCGYNQIMVTDFYQYGETGKQVYQQFPVQMAMSTYPAEGHGYQAEKIWSNKEYAKEKYTDSAASGTAFATGFKTYNKVLGLDTLQEAKETILERAESLNKSSGLVTTVPITHATPAAFAVHHHYRKDYEEIAEQLLVQSAVDVIMGCGHPEYDHDGLFIQSSKKDYKFVGGEILWQNLKDGKAGGDADGDGQDDPWTLIQNREDFVKLGTGETPKRVLGIAKIYETLQNNRGGDAHADPYEVPLIETVPTLAEMAAGALNLLEEDSDGFFLMVEGGAIDWACHDNETGRLIEEEIDFNRAVETVCDWVHKNSNWDETLVIVTADHETGYLTGPVPEEKVSEGDYPWGNPVNRGKGNVPEVVWHSGSHTNSLVPFFAKGPGSELFLEYAVNEDPVRGMYCDNTDVAKMIFKLWSK